MEFVSAQCVESIAVICQPARGRAVRDMTQPTLIIGVGGHGRKSAELAARATKSYIASDNVILAEREINATSAMKKAERERFDSGAVVFFVLNMRRERTGDARIKQIEAKLKLWHAIADYYLATL